jgi:hypothetical protein
MYLAGKLLHRGAQTEDERSAAQFIQGRFREYTADVEMDHFQAIENYPYLFASYYSEFILVGVLAIWWPLVALVYGVGAFLAYLMEFMGYPAFSRLLPHFESQNVIARYHAEEEPKALYVVTAHYDSGCASPLTDPGVVPLLRPLHLGTLACMVVVLSTCAVDTIGLFQNIEQPVTDYVRWTAVGFLACVSLIMFYSSAQGEEIRGANVNASGVTALLRLGERFSETPLRNADVWLVATGSHEAWMSGVRHFLSTQKLDKRTTHLLNIEGIGAGELRYLTEEGMLHRSTSSAALLSAAEATAGEFDAGPGTLRAIPSAAHIPMARGHHALTLMGLDEDGLPPHWNAISDRVTEVSEENIVRAADFGEAILRRLDGEIE